MVRKLLIPLIAGLFVAGCHGGAMTAQEAEQKFDPPLRAAISAQEAAEDSSPLDVFIRLNRAPDDRIRRQLSSDGVEVRTTTGMILTAIGTPEALRRAARRDYVVRMELSQEQHLH